MKRHGLTRHLQTISAKRSAFMRRSHSRAVWGARFGAGFIAALSIMSCDQRSANPSAPLDGEPTAALTSCGDACIIFNSALPFQASSRLTDSANVTMGLAMYTVRGVPGDRIGLLLTAPAEKLTRRMSNTPVFIQIDGVIQSIPLADLIQPQVIYHFTHASDVVVRYSIPRAIADTSFGSTVLSQTLNGAKVVSGNNFWATQKEASRVTAVQTLAGTCGALVNTASFSVCGISGSIVPFAIASEPVGCIWTSAGNTGASTTITITLDEPVNQVSITACDVDYAGNAVTAYDASGHQLATAAFTGDNTPNQNTRETKSLSATGIRKILLTVAPHDYVTYQDLVFQGPGAGTDTLVVTPHAVSRKEGQSAKFSVTTKSGKAVTVARWTWSQGPTALTSVPASCGTNKTCTMPFYGSGNLSVYGTVNGIAATPDSAVVTVTPCDTSNLDADPLIASQSFRKAMAELIDGTNGYERVAHIYYNAQTGSYLPIEFKNVSDQPCIKSDLNESLGPLSPVPAGYSPIKADFHTHPWPAWSPIPTWCDSRGISAGEGGPSAMLSDKYTVQGDYPFEINRGNAGYLADKDGFVWRWLSPWEGSYASPSVYARETDANGNSSCLDRQKL